MEFGGAPVVSLPVDELESTRAAIEQWHLAQCFALPSPRAPTERYAGGTRSIAECQSRYGGKRDCKDGTRSINSCSRVDS